MRRLLNMICDLAQLDGRAKGWNRVQKLWHEWVANHSSLTVPREQWGVHSANWRNFIQSLDPSNGTIPFPG